MANVQQFNFTAPSSLNTEQQKIDRQRKMAELMQQQAFQPMEQGQMVSGIYVKPHFTQGLAKILQSYLGVRDMDDADKKQEALAASSNKALVDGLQNYQRTAQGTPSQDFQVLDDEYGAQTATSPAVAGDKKAALAQLLNSGHPALQQLGMQQMMAKPESPFSKVDPKDFTAESVRKFAASNDYADLMPVRKMELAPSGVAYNPYDLKSGMVFNDPNKLMSIDGGGNAVVNQPLMSAKKDIARAGASNTNVSVNTANKPMLQEIGKGVGESVNSAFEGAKAAVGTLNNVTQMREGLKNAIVGPAANARITLSQIGQVMGVTGKDTAEQLQNTRSVMQGLARQELAAAAAMKGQGQITESERGILRRAEAGDISELTKPELETLFGALEKTAKFRIDQHNKNLERLQQDPNAQGVVDYMRVDIPQTNQAQGSAPTGKVRRFNPATGRIE